MNDEKWWNKLAKYIDRSIGSSVIFSIDGLADTHHLYRGISYDKVMYNAKSFISSGGNAVWQYIVFKHNQHQIKEAKKECERLGFSEFRPIVSFLYGRNMEKPDGIIDFREGLEKFKPGVIAACPWTKQEMIYITEAGEVFPCCNIWPHYCDIIGVGERYKKIIDIYNENKNLINLYHHSLKEILANPFFDYIYNNINDIEQCVRSCGVNQVIRNCLFTGQAEKLLR
jgi:sulfatase maturation enzyme AslB (radical SAM superfamily)